MSAAAQQYCLRWNNHRTNLLTVFDELLQNEAFTDVTLVCEGGNPIKCHRMVLAACSPYFQNLFTDLPCKHPVVVLKDVKYSEIKAILEYMYRGEVNVAQDQLAALLRVAEALKVKGLVEEKRSDQQPPLQRQISPPPTHHQQDQQQQQQLTPHQLHNMRHRNDEPMDQSPSAITTSTSSLPAPTVHSSSTNSPPHSTNGHFGGGGGGNSNNRNHYAMYGKPPSSSTSSMMERKMNLPIWAVPGLPMPQHHSSPIPTARSPHSHAIAATAAAAMLNSCYNTSEADISSHMRNRKKMPSSGSASSSTVAMNRDTPILRTVLGQGQVDSSQPVSLVCHSDSHDLVNSNSNGVDDLKPDKHIKNEPLEDAQSPFTDLSPSMDEEKFIKMGLQSSSPQQSYCNISSGIATYVPSQKPEWKRYKQYTRNDIMSAIEAVRNGMSALQAARKYGVPSRTLYDKVKKLGITTSRPFKRGSNGSSGSGFSFSQLSESEEHSLNNNSSNALIEATSSFLQHALDGHRGPSVGGSMGAGNIDEREALAAMAAAAAARAAVMSGHSSSPRSPSPRRAGSSGKPYIHQSGSSSNSLTPSPPGGGDLLHHSHHHHHHHHSETNGSSERDREDMEEEEEEEYDDQQQVEDLSVGRRQQTTPPPQSHSPQLQQQQPLPVASQESRVIMPPMNIASILKKEELLKESIMEDMRREVKVDEAP